MIRRIELVNFMSHARTVIEPAEGLTVLVGPNNCGKSAVVAALQILCHNENSTYVMRHGEKECSITVETDDGHAVQWSRRDTGGVRYVIDGQPFDRLGKAVPDVLHDVLRLPKVVGDKEDFDVHFGEQKSPVFLLDAKGAYAAQFFAASSDAARLLEMQVLHRRKILEAKSETTQLKKTAAELAGELQILTAIDAVSPALADVEERHLDLAGADARVDGLTVLASLLVSAAGLSDRLKAEAEAFSELKAPPQQRPTTALDEHVRAMTGVGLQARQQSATAAALGPLEPPPAQADVPSLATVAAMLGKTERASSHHRAAASVLRSLSSPPRLDNAAPLEAHVDVLVLAEERAARARLLSETLRRLPATPALASDVALNNDLARLRDANAALRRATVTADHLNSLQPAPALADVAPLARHLDQFRELQANLALQDGVLKQVGAELDLASAEIGRWVQSHDTCPTCGQPLSAEHLLSHARRSGGGSRE